jgi:hypothetical protein
LEKKEEKNEKKGKVKKNAKYKKKRRRNALWITVVIHSAFGCGETMIPPHHLDVCIMCLFYSFLNHLNFFLCLLDALVFIK